MWFVTHLQSPSLAELLQLKISKLDPRRKALKCDFTNCQKSSNPVCFSVYGKLKTVLQVFATLLQSQAQSSKKSRSIKISRKETFVFNIPFNTVSHQDHFKGTQESCDCLNFQLTVLTRFPEVFLYYPEFSKCRWWCFILDFIQTDPDKVCVKVYFDIWNGQLHLERDACSRFSVRDEDDGLALTSNLVSFKKSAYWETNNLVQA